MSNNLNRRDFLKSTTLAGFGIAASSTMLTGCAKQLLSSPASMIGFKDKPKDLIKIGFVGIGNMGLGHVRNLAKIQGCPFANRCPHVMDICRQQPPAWIEFENGKNSFTHKVACFLHQERVRVIENC